MQAEPQTVRLTHESKGRDSVAKQWSLERQSLVASGLELAGGTGPGREAVARSICAALIQALWNCQVTGTLGWEPWETSGERLPLPVVRQTRDAATLLTDLPLAEASFCISTVYTDLLPPKVRATRGVFYTPPVLADRLLDLVEGEGVRLSAQRILDPACGGGAFLLPVAARILEAPEMRLLEPSLRLERLESHLAGIEIDPFAAWMTQSFLQLLVYPLSERAGRGLRVPIRREDALRMDCTCEPSFGLVIGNPPYGRVRLEARQRERFCRSVFGHANSYGLFLDAALRWREEEGLIAFVTPTSFLGGRYFCRLRNLLLDEAPPRTIEIVEHRRGVFDQVQQEMCLVVFGPRCDGATKVQHLGLDDKAIRVTNAGTCELPNRPDAPWLLPRTPQQAVLVNHATGMRTRLHHLGYKASTGPLVWNRHKECLRTRPSKTAYPLIWAEAVRPNRFCFEYRSRAHAPFVQVEAGQGHLLDSGPCVLVQRTTAKEQRRRLIACPVPRDFADEWEHFVVENHVNVLRASGSDSVSPSALAAVLNTETVDQLFRCLSGSVAVSATELHALPLPPRETFQEVEALLLEASFNGKGLDPRTEKTVETLVAQFYGGGSS